MEQRYEHYLIEKELADKLRAASREERRSLYSSVYDELYQRVPHHTQLARKSSPEESQADVALQMATIKPFLNKDGVFLEVGPGDCAVSLEVAKYVKQVYAVDVSTEITKNLASPPNFKLVLSDGSSIPVSSNTVNVAYSNQLMEHIHPEDAFEQLQNIYSALALGGVYICITPNRLSGPHDISRYFDTEASGFHLKEYTVSELKDLFKKVGFSKTKVNIGMMGKYINIPVSLSVLTEKLLMILPQKIRKFIASNLPVRKLIGVRLVGIK
jgi:ubiquinone/menaquinone biosynthesis C-methylase UbiE